MTSPNCRLPTANCRNSGLPSQGTGTEKSKIRCDVTRRHSTAISQRPAANCNCQLQTANYQPPPTYHRPPATCHLPTPTGPSCRKKIVMSLEFKTSRTHSLTHRQTDRQTDRHTDRHTDTQTLPPIVVCSDVNGRHLPNFPPLFPLFLRACGSQLTPPGGKKIAPVRGGGSKKHIAWKKRRYGFP